jgi:hypothetical protein
VEDLLELRQLYANLRRFFADSGHRGKREADAREFLCHNVSRGGTAGQGGSVNINQLRYKEKKIIT